MGAGHTGSVRVSLPRRLCAHWAPDQAWPAPAWGFSGDGVRRACRVGGPVLWASWDLETPSSTCPKARFCGALPAVRRAGPLWASACCLSPPDLCRSEPGFLFSIFSVSRCLYDASLHGATVW